MGKYEKPQLTVTPLNGQDIVVMSPVDNNFDDDFNFNV